MHDRNYGHFACGTLHLLDSSPTGTIWSFRLQHSSPLFGRFTYKAKFKAQFCNSKNVYWFLQKSVNQSINKFISRHSTEAHATVWLCRIKEKCLKTDLKCVNGWSSSTVQSETVDAFELSKLRLNLANFMFHFDCLLFEICWVKSQISTLDV